MGGLFMRKKHYLVPILGLMMAFLLVGCAGSEEPAETTSNGESQSAEPSQKEEVQALQVSVEGNVENPLDFSLSDFEGQEVTIEAEKKKCEETEAAQEYTGIPLSVILNEATPAAESTKLTVTSSDGYEKNFVLENVMADESLIISEQDGSLQIIAGDTEKYDASYWVSDVVKITVS
jgi:PBP1b-binding outer membrane lipoprotein LpoB